MFSAGAAFVFALDTGPLQIDTSSVCLFKALSLFLDVAACRGRNDDRLGSSQQQDGS